jgi:chromosome segregation ATPase
MQIVTPSPTPASPGSVVATSRSATGGRSASRSTTTARSLAHQLERDRIEQRATQVRKVIHALRERADARDTVGGAPRPLRAAIEDFGRELAELERRLRHQGPAGS